MNPLSANSTSGHPWFGMLASNAWIPVVLLALWPLGYAIERQDGLDPYLGRIVLLIGINMTLAISLQLINGISGQFSLGHAGFMAVGAYLSGYATNAYAPEFRNPDRVFLFFLTLLVVLGIAAGVLLLVTQLVLRSRKLHPLLPLWLCIALLAWFVADAALAGRSDAVPFYLFWSRGILASRALFLWMLDHSLFASDALWQMIAPHLPAALLGFVLTCLKPLTFLIVLLGGGLCAAVAGLIVGLPTLRLRGDYLAIATLGFAEIIRVAFVNAQNFGGATGMSIPTYANSADGAVGAHYIFPWVYAAVVITFIVIWRLAHSPKGRAIAAVREDEIAASAIGIDTTHHKILSFIIGAFFAGIGGALFAHNDGYLNPNSFGILRSIELVVIVTLGGLGSLWGALIAAIVLTWLPEFLRDPAFWLALALKPFGVAGPAALHLPSWLVDTFAFIGTYRMVFYSLLLIAMMLLRAQRLPHWLRFPLRSQIRNPKSKVHNGAP